MKQIIASLLKSIGLGILIGTVILWIVYGRFPSLMDIDSDKMMWTAYGYYCMYAIVLSVLDRFWFDFVNHRIKWKERTNYRLPIGFVGGVLVTMGGVLGLRIFTEMGLQGESWTTFVDGETAATYLFSLVLAMLIATIFHLVHFFRSKRSNKMEINQ